MRNPRIQPEVVVDCVCHTGEGPLWHPDEQRLYWVDIPAGILYRLDPSTGGTESFELGMAVGGLTIEADGALLLFMARGAVKRWHDGQTQTVLESIADEMDNRFNDVIADPRGRVFCGTMSTPDRAGRLYRLDPDGTLTQLLDGIGTSNGMGFTLDGKRMYYTDTRRQQIYLFDYDEATGAITNQRLFLHAKEGDGRPDGMTVDSDDCVWSARWGGNLLIRVDPDANELERYAFPARNVSCATFGGPDYGDIYVTTAAVGDPSGNGPHAGALFRLRTGVTGRPEFRSRIVC